MKPLRHRLFKSFGLVVLLWANVFLDGAHPVLKGFFHAASFIIIFVAMIICMQRSERFFLGNKLGWERGLFLSACTLLPLALSSISGTMSWGGVVLFAWAGAIVSVTALVLVGGEEVKREAQFIETLSNQ